MRRLRAEKIHHTPCSACAPKSLRQRALGNPVRCDNTRRHVSTKLCPTMYREIRSSLSCPSFLSRQLRTEPTARKTHKGHQHDYHEHRQPHNLEDEIGFSRRWLEHKYLQACSHAKRASRDKLAPKALSKGSAARQ